jgi:hypothetical protein
MFRRKVKQATADMVRTRRLIDLASVKTIGVLFDATKERRYLRAAHLVRHFKGMAKEVTAIGVVKTVELPHYVDNTLSFHYVTKNKVNWYGIPSLQSAPDFVNREFDILIDLNFDRDISLRYLLECSLAHCKIGLNQGNEEDLYDFMLEGISPNDINIFLKELLFYLELIKTN